jgi:anti-sigma28 factor (negative regulator of flagellin synthesis)
LQGGFVVSVGIGPNLPFVSAGAPEKSKGGSGLQKVDPGVRGSGDAVIVEYSAEYQEHFGAVKRVKEEIKKSVDRSADKARLRDIKARIEAGIYSVVCSELASDMLDLA